MFVMVVTVHWRFTEISEIGLKHNIRLEGSMKTKKYLSQDSRYLGRDLNP
jgi:hypothetical protein